VRPIVKSRSVRAGRNRINGRPVIPADLRVVQVYIIITYLSPAAERVVKRHIEMIPVSADPYEIPCVPVADPVRRIRLGDDHHAADRQPVAEQLDRLGDAFADTDACCKRPHRFVGVFLFQLVIADIPDQKIMDVQFFLLFRTLFHWPQKACDPRFQRVALRGQLALFIQIDGAEIHIIGIFRIEIAKIRHIEDFGVVKFQSGPDLGEYGVVQFRHARARRQCLKTDKHGGVGFPLVPIHLKIIGCFHGFFLCARDPGTVDRYRRG